jgi:hypothetical protein
MAVVDGAPLAEEIHSGPEDVRAYIAAEFRKLFATREFLDALAGYLLPDQASQARVSRATMEADLYDRNRFPEGGPDKCNQIEYDYVECDRSKARVLLLAKYDIDVGRAII